MKCPKCGSEYKTGGTDVNGNAVCKACQLKELKDLGFLNDKNITQTTSSNKIIIETELTTDEMQEWLLSIGTTRKPMLEEIRELKHRADVAEEALRLACEKAYDIRVSMDTLSCSSCWLCEEQGMCGTYDKFEAGAECYDKWQEYFIEQAEERLKERV